MKIQNTILAVLLLISSISFGQNLVKITTQNWDGNISGWKNSGYKAYQYENNRLITETHFEWDSKKEEYIPERKHDFDYDDAGNLTSFSNSYWSHLSKEFKRSSVTEYYPNEFFENDSIIRYGISNQGEKILNKKSVFFYDENLRLTDFSEFIWDTETNILMNGQRDSCQYDSSGLFRTGRKGQKFDLNHEWHWYGDYEEEFDENGNQVYYQLMTNGFDSYTIVHLSEYDEFGALTMNETYQVWPDTSIRESSVEHAYERDKFENITKIQTKRITPESPSPIHINRTFEYYCDNLLKTEYIESLPFNTRRLYQYDQPPECEMKNDDFEFTVYPNPSRGFVNINSEISAQTDNRIIVFDLLGRIHFEIPDRSRTERFELDLSGLTKGVYFIQIENDNVRKTRKLMIGN